MNWKLKRGEQAIFGDGLDLNGLARIVCIDPEDGEVAVFVEGKKVLGGILPDGDDKPLIASVAAAMACRLASLER